MGHFRLPRFLHQLLYLLINLNQLLLLLLKHGLALLFMDHVVLELRLVVLREHRGRRLGAAAITRVLTRTIG